MDLGKVYKIVKKNWHFDIELVILNKEKMKFNADIVAEKYFPGNCVIEGTVYPNGTHHVFFTFRRVDMNFQTLVKINSFNGNNSFFKSYVVERDGETYFELHYTSLNASNEKEVASSINWAIDNLISDSNLEYLSPIFKEIY